MRARRQSLFIYMGVDTKKNPDASWATVTAAVQLKHAAQGFFLLAWLEFELGLAPISSRSEGLGR